MQENRHRPDLSLFKPSVLHYGGDYNPEQWRSTFGTDENSIWQEDMRLMHLAHVNLVTLGVFSWVEVQQDEETFTFDWLDRIVNILFDHHISICLATGTAAQPAWLSLAYPDVLPVDQLGRRRGHGRRQYYCPTNPDFRRLAGKLVSQLAQRYGQHPSLVLWHVSNEYGPVCYCEHCATRFRLWLAERYGSLEGVNQHWNTSFWSHTYTSWDQIIAPGPHSENSIQGLSLDYQRFLSDMNLECYSNEAAILRALTPTIPITTNFMATNMRPFKSIDYASWASHLDIISWDSYPMHGTPPVEIAFCHDLMRGLKRGQPWLLMEQTPSQTQWMRYNSLHRPGTLRMQSYQALAHGADALLYFQWRQSHGGAEMFHGAIVSHAGHEHTRVFSEVATIGQELSDLGESIVGSRIQSRVALLFSWPNWWNLEFTPGISSFLDYIEEVRRYYQSCWQRNIAVDIISPDADLDAYDLVIAPLLNMVTQKQASSFEYFVERGGIFLTGYFSGIVGEDARAWLGGYPGPLRKLLGIWVEEFDPLRPEMTNQVRVREGGKLLAGTYDCHTWCDLLHLEGATALAEYTGDFYAGYPALTEHIFGAGKALYVATHLEQALIDVLLGALLDELQIVPPLVVPPGVEVTSRSGEMGMVSFVLNHTDEIVSFNLAEPVWDCLHREQYDEGVYTLAPGDVAILLIKNKEREND